MHAPACRRRERGLSTPMTPSNCVHALCMPVVTSEVESPDGDPCERVRSGSPSGDHYGSELGRLPSSRDREARPKPGGRATPARRCRPALPARPGRGVAVPPGGRPGSGARSPFRPLTPYAKRRSCAGETITGSSHTASSIRRGTVFGAFSLLEAFPCRPGQPRPADPARVRSTPESGYRPDRGCP